MSARPRRRAAGAWAWTATAAGRALLALGCFALLGMGYRPESGAEGSVDTYARALAGYFRPLGLVPILVPVGQSPGDVYSLTTARLLDRRARCFPDLAAPEQHPFPLPAVVSLPKTRLNLGGGMDGVVRYAAESENVNELSIRFVDAHSASVSLGALADGLSPRCAYLRRRIEGMAEPVDAGAEPPVVLGTVVTARPEIVISFVGSADLETEIEALTRLVHARQRPDANGTVTPAGPGLPSVAWSSRYGEERRVVLRADRAIPVAFAPAFYPRPVAVGVVDAIDRILRHGATGVAEPTDPLSVLWQPFDPARDPEATLVLDRLVRAYLRYTP